jgi:hypothetical protein
MSGARLAFNITIADFSARIGNIPARHVAAVASSHHALDPDAAAAQSSTRNRKRHWPCLVGNDAPLSPDINSDEEGHVPESSCLRPSASAVKPQLLLFLDLPVSPRNRPAIARQFLHPKKPDFLPQRQPSWTRL